jgi:hypothetical protein
MKTTQIILDLTYTSVVKEYSKVAQLPLETAIDQFYHSFTYYLMSNGISDMHCRSDGYLAEELMREYYPSKFTTPQ